MIIHAYVVLDDHSLYACFKNIIYFRSAYDGIESDNAHEGPRCHTVYRESEKYFNSVLTHDLEVAGM